MFPLLCYMSKYSGPVLFLPSIFLISVLSILLVLVFQCTILLYCFLIPSPGGRQIEQSTVAKKQKQKGGERSSGYRSPSGP